MSAKHQNQQAFLATSTSKTIGHGHPTELFRDGFVKPKASKHSTKTTRTASPSALGAFLQAPQHQFPETVTILVRTSDGSWVVVEETLDRPEQSSPGGIGDGFASDQSSLRTALARDPQKRVTQRDGYLMDSVLYCIVCLVKRSKCSALSQLSSVCLQAVSSPVKSWVGLPLKGDSI